MASRALDKKLPFLAPSSLEVLKHWTPSASFAFGLDPKVAERALTTKKKFDYVANFVRHRLTWGYTHIALGCVHHYSISYYIAELFELGTAFGIEFLERYDRIKISKILEAITVQGELLKLASNPSAFTTKDQAKDWLSSQLSHQDETLIQNTRLALNVPQMAGAFHADDAFRQTPRDQPREPRDGHSGKSKPFTPEPRVALRSRSRGHRDDRRAQPKQPPHARERSPQRKPGRGGPPSGHRDHDISKDICFHHDPSANKTCPDPKCPRQHLDTKDDNLARRFKAAQASVKG